MSRVLVKASGRGWFIDATDPEGGKVRKQDGDQIFDDLFEAQQALAVLEKAHGPQHGNGHGAEQPETHEEAAPVAPRAKTAPKTKAVRQPAEPTTMEIRCAWIDGGKNDGTPFETLKLKGGKTIKGLTPAQQKKACGRKRTIKTQDAFQVRYCGEHQEENRKRLRREKARARTAKRRTEREKAAA